MDSSAQSNLLAASPLNVRFKRTMLEIMARGSVMPVLTIQDPSQAGQLARALVDSGVVVFEVVLRTSGALDALREMVRAAPEADIGAGTLLTPQDVTRAIEAGAAFGVSPGCTPELAHAVRDMGFPFLPGVATASEVMSARQHGFRELKLFPAQGSAGAAWLRDMASVFPDVMFCPTGGIRPPDIPGYLGLPNCSIVGGSWVVPADALKAGDWSAIVALAKQAASFAVKP
jgi:2-dehydro-3-deoxyphosphogluconate aldolase / (4S)-4-hydroxy-2-oxoglutarate aldolase